MQITEEIESGVLKELDVSSLQLQVPSSCTFPAAGDEKMTRDQAGLGKGAESKNRDGQNCKAESGASELSCHSTAGQWCQGRLPLALGSPVLWSAFVKFDSIIDCHVLTN